MSKEFIIRFVTVLLAAVFLFTAIIYGTRNGKLLAVSEMVATNALSLSAGMEFFYQDQGRFPTATEFASPNVMLNYFSQFPAYVEKTTNCPENFVYRRPTSREYTLSFCLEKAVMDNPKAWSNIQVNKP